MFLSFGRPKSLSELGVTLPEVSTLKRRVDIAVVDDESFVRVDALRNHGFRITEIGGDIRSVDQVAAFPVVVCDVRGVARALGSKYEGAHLVSEIRKSFPDKFLVAYTGVSHDVTYNEKLMHADKWIQKDATVDQWIELLERGLSSVGDPKQRWTRFRLRLLERGVELFDLMKLEQAFIKSISVRDSALFNDQAKKLPFSDELKDLAIKFGAYAVVQLVDQFVAK